MTAAASNCEQHCIRADCPPRSYIVPIKINETVVVIFHQDSFERVLIRDWRLQVKDGGGGGGQFNMR